MSILPGQIVPTTPGDQDVKNGVQAASVVSTRPSHDSLRTDLVDDAFPLIIAEANLHPPFTTLSFRFFQDFCNEF